ncbi:MAG: hypothetical protein CM15mV4_0900 [Caudoviricetes sp.]|nr:MAG: hypothetical protein CM15mV4_0900 [Caudoviricetes sp.]
MKFSFQKQFGKGTDPRYAKAERWVYKNFKNPYLQHLGIGLIEWLKQKWIDVKIENTMRDVDSQQKLMEEWDEQEGRQSTPHIVETGVFGDEGWSIEISNPIVERGPTQLAQAWLLQAMHNDYKKMKGSKNLLSQIVRYQTTMKEVFIHTQ